MNKKVKYVSLYHYCRARDAEYNIQFNRGEKPAKTPRYKNPTPASLKRIAGLFWNLINAQPTFQQNYIHIQAYTKGE